MEMPFLARPYRVLSYKVCKRLFLLQPAVINQFSSITRKIHKAELYMTIEEYIATALFTIIITSPFIFLTVNMTLTTVMEMEKTMSLMLALLFTVIAAGIVLIMFFIYPSYRTDSIKRNIETNLPYATTHMATISGTGVPLYLVFKIIGDFEEYGEISKQCRRISRNIEAFGYDTITALSDAAAETPSANLKDLLWGMVSLIRTGGDMKQFMMEKARIYMDNQKNIESEYVDSLELLAEMYTTIFVAGPLLLVVMVTIMGSMGTLPFETGFIFTLLVYALMPVLSVIFMLVIESSKPAGAV